MTAAPGADQPTPRDQLAEESVDLTPGVVWTDAQLDVVRKLLARAVRAEADRERAKVEGGAEALERAAEDLAATPGNPYPLVITEFLTGRAEFLRATTGQPPDGTPVR